MRSLLLILLFPAALLAQTSKPTEIIFDPEDVHGGVQNPETEEISVRIRKPLGSLIEIRQDFKVELLQSAEEI